MSDCDVNDLDYYNKSPIFYAVKYLNNNIRHCNIKICDLLLRYGANINLTDMFGWTCIYYAIVDGKEDIVEYLVNNGAIINIEGVNLFF
jgi:ankyrin repeat protein